MEGVIDALNKFGLEYKVEENRVMIKAIVKKIYPIYYAFPRSIFEQNGIEIRIEELIDYTPLVIKTPDKKEYRIPIGRESYPFMFHVDPYLIIEFRNYDRPPIPERQKKEMEQVIRLLSGGGVKFDVIYNRIWIEGIPMYMTPCEILVRQDEDYILFRRYISDTTLIHIKGDIDRDLPYLKTVTARYTYPYLILTFQR